MKGDFEMCVKTHFSAAHFLRGYSGDCARLHGHNWTIEVFVRCRELNEIGVGIDFRDVKLAAGEVLKDLDHSNLNDLPVFKDMNPTSENIARFLYKELCEKLNSDNAKVSRVTVCETPTSQASYREE
jgi:6-pyruvoyltetrahydropterin/6-carboxytetrahydropterin synthase